MWKVRTSRLRRNIADVYIEGLYILEISKLCFIEVKSYCCYSIFFLVFLVGVMLEARVFYH